MQIIDDLSFLHTWVSFDITFNYSKTEARTISKNDDLGSILHQTKQTKAIDGHSFHCHVRGPLKFT